MGNILFPKKAPPQNNVSEQDQAVLKLKKQRDTLKKYQKQLETTMEKLQDGARERAKKGDKKGARELLRRKKYQETLLLQTDQNLTNLEELTRSIEFAQMEQQVVTGIEAGNKALKILQEEMSLEKVEAIMDDMQEGIEWSNQINERMAETLTPADDEALLQELDAMVTGELEAKLPDAPSGDAVDDVSNKLPDAPTNTPGATKTEKTPVPAQ
eukprot:m.253688 g.253688  ORF g.253688 m.253688 type:complete len:213 (-) comp16162_c0_seq7:3382-4020(-)